MRSDRQLWHFDIDVGWYVDLEDQAAEAGHFRDLDQDGTSEWLTDADFPEPWTMAARLLDIDQDGDLDFVASSPERYAIHSSLPLPLLFCAQKQIFKIFLKA